MSIESRSRQYGKVFDHWQIKEFLGQGSGGKSAVFRLTRSDSTRGTSALKVINLIEERGSIEELSSFRKSAYLAACEDCSNKAEQEVWLMDDLQGNTNIVDYLDHTFVDWSDEFGFGRDMLIRMELLKDLRGVIQKGHVFSEAEVLKVGKDICTALVLCHRKNILHRDIKPENIFVNKDGNFKLGDFGVSRILSAAPMAMASTGIGTPEYAAPEQFTGHHDKRVDIYSLGLVLYELGNLNRLPFAESTYARQEDIRRRHMGEPLPVPCNVGDDFGKVILKACAHRAEARYQTAGEFLKALNGIAKHLASERVATSKRENTLSDIKAKPIHSSFETQKAVYDEYMTAPAKPNQEESAFDWDAYSTMMAKAEEPTEFVPRREKNTYRSTGRFETKKQDTHRKKQSIYAVLAISATLLLMLVTGVLVAYIWGSTPRAYEEPVITSPQEKSSTETFAETVITETTQSIVQTLPQEKETTNFLETDSNEESNSSNPIIAPPPSAPKTVEIPAVTSPPNRIKPTKPTREETIPPETEPELPPQKQETPAETTPVETKPEIVPREISWVLASASPTYDSTGGLTGIWCQGAFRFSTNDYSGISIKNSFGSTDSGGPMYVESYDYEWFGFYLPDDPSIEGGQTLSVIHDGKTDSVAVNLKYLGSFSDSIGKSYEYFQGGWEVLEWHPVT